MLGQYMNISYGIVLPIIILFGVSGNFIALCVLRHRSLSNSPVCLLKVLVVHGIATMGWAIYMEVIPTIQMYFLVQHYLRGLQSEKFDMLSLINSSNILEMNKTFWIPSQNQSKATSGGYTTFTGLNEMKSQSVKTFIAYNLIHIGLLVTLMLALERCVAVVLPLKAMRCLTANRSRILVILMILLCIVVHLPQLIKEFSMSNDNSIDGKILTIRIKIFRKEYQYFCAYLSIGVCVVTFVLNMILLVKIIHIKRNLKSSRHIKSTQRNENQHISGHCHPCIFPATIPYHCYRDQRTEI